MKKLLAAIAFAFAFAFVLSGCAAPGPPSAAPAPSSSSVPFGDFVGGLNSARYADYAGRPGVAVRDEAAFEEMRGHLLRQYGSAIVLDTVSLMDVVLDCLRSDRFPGTPPPPQTPPLAQVPQDSPATNASLCPAGSVPVRRVTLDEMVRFPTLADFLGKGPAGGGVPPATSR